MDRTNMAVAMCEDNAAEIAALRARLAGLGKGGLEKLIEKCEQNTAEIAALRAAIELLGSSSGGGAKLQTLSATGNNVVTLKLGTVGAIGTNLAIVTYSANYDVAAILYAGNTKLTSGLSPIVTTLPKSGGALSVSGMGLTSANAYIISFG